VHHGDDGLALAEYPTEVTDHANPCAPPEANSLAAMPEASDRCCGRNLDEPRGKSDARAGAYRQGRGMPLEER
jgi:hypothetical protein